MLTPPLVSSASHVAAAPRMAADDGFSVVANEAEIDDLEAVGRHERAERVPVRVAQLTGTQRRAAFDQLVARRQHTDACARATT